jgi:aspartate racemase
MIGILGGMGTQAGLDFCSKLAKLNRGRIDQKYPLFILYNKATIPDRKQYKKKYKKVLNSLLEGCKFLQKNNCKFIAIPCNTAHYWYSDLKKKIKIPILNMPELVYKSTSKSCETLTKIGLLATEPTIKTRIYSKIFKNKFRLVVPTKNIQNKNVNKSIKFVKMGKTQEAEKVLKPAVNYLLKMNCKKIILGCTELPVAIFAYKSFKRVKLSKTFLDPNLILAEASMRKYKGRK